MAKGDTEVVFRPDNKSECLQTLERSQTIIKARGRKPKRLFLRHLTSDTRGKGDEILATIRRCNSVAPKLLQHCLIGGERLSSSSSSENNKRLQVLSIATDIARFPRLNVCGK